MLYLSGEQRVARTRFVVLRSGRGWRMDAEPEQRVPRYRSDRWILPAATQARNVGYTFSHLPVSAERNSASIARMFLTASSRGNSTGFPERTASENSSP